MQSSCRVRAPRRELGFFQLTALGINGIIGVGIFFAPSQVAATVPGMRGLWVYALVALFLIPIAAIYATLGSRFRSNGGPYVWAEAAFGPSVAFLIGWLTFVSAVFSTAAVVSGSSLHLGASLGLAGPLGVRAVSVGMVLALTAVMLRGLEPSARVWTGFMLAKVLTLAFLLAFAFGSARQPAPPIIEHAEDSAGSMRAALVVVFAMQGFEVVPVLAKDTRHFSRVVPLATLVSLVFVSVLYVAIHWTCLRALPALAQSERPLVDAAAALGGPEAGQLLVLGTSVSALGIAFGMITITPHYLSVLGREPAFHWLGHTGPHALPRRAVVITAAVVALLTTLGSLNELLVLSSIAVMSQYAVSGLALVRLAHRGDRGLRWWHTCPAPLGIAAIALLLTGVHLRELAVASAVMLAGAVLYLAKPRSVG